MAPKRPKRPALGHRRPCAFTCMWARRGHRKPDGECQMTRLAYGDAASGERPVYTLCDNCGRALCVDCLERVADKLDTYFRRSHRPARRAACYGGSCVAQARGRRPRARFRAEARWGRHMAGSLPAVLRCEVLQALPTLKAFAQGLPNALTRAGNGPPVVELPNHRTTGRSPRARGHPPWRAVTC